MDTNTKNDVVPSSFYKYGQKLDFAEQLTSALEYLHERHIMYRDLKPQNVGIRGNTIQLFDFGLVRELPRDNNDDGEESSSKNSGKVDKDKLFEMSGAGTRRYCAPEVILGEAYNLQVDVYSMTILLYEMMTHIKPFEVMGPESHRLLVAEYGERPALSNDWPKDLQTLFRQGWAANPSDRPTMKELKQQITKLHLTETFQHHRQHSHSVTSPRFLSSILLGRRAEQEEGDTKPKLWLHRSLRVIPRLIRRTINHGSSTGEQRSSPSFSNTDDMSTFDSFDS